MKHGHSRQANGSGSLGTSKLGSPDLNPSTVHHGLGLGDTDEEDYPYSAYKASADTLERQNQSATSSPSPVQPQETELGPSRSTASSVDGYDSLENTNNKKKRKIPTANDSAGVHPQPNNTHSALGGIALQNKGDKQYHTNASYSSSAGAVAGPQGLSTLNRGRLIHLRNGRSPLRTIPDGGNTWPTKGARNQRGYSKGERHKCKTFPFPPPPSPAWLPEQWYQGCTVVKVKLGVV